MANVTEVQGCCYEVIRLDHLQQQRPTLMSGDYFKFYVGVLSYSYDTNFNRNFTSSQYGPFEYIQCQSFFQDCGDFLRIFFSHPRFSMLNNLHRVIDGVISKVREQFKFDHNVANALESQPREFPLGLIIMMEEFEHNFRMVPAYEEAINMLIRKSKVTKLNEPCAICLEEFNIDSDGDDNNNVVELPCDHVFHQQCIVPWLQTSHLCPLCRYALPTEQGKDN